MKSDETAPEWIAPPAGTGDFKADGSVPMTGAFVSTGNQNIGSAAAEAGNIYIADSKIIYGQNDQSATLTSGAGKFTANAFAVTNALTAGTINGHTFTAGSSTFTGTAGQTYTFPTTTATIARTDAANTFTGTQTFGTDVVLTSPTAGARVTGGNGAITFKGEGDGTDEDLTINLNSSNIATVSSSTGVGIISLGAINMLTTGTFLGAVNVINTSSNPYTISTSLNHGYGSAIFCGGTLEIDLPPGASGMTLLIYNEGAYTITIDPNGSEVIVRDGTTQSAGISMTLSSGAGNYVSLIHNGTNWKTVGYKGTLAEGS
jgi:hypothetical protein